jgi:hypothetical protein
VATKESRSASSTLLNSDSTLSKDAKSLLIQGNVQLLHPLSSHIVDFICPKFGSASALSETRINESLISSLNKTISKGKLLWKLGNTEVLALDLSFAVKIGEAIDVSHIPTLQSIKENCPSLPAPDVHGVLKSDRNVYLFMSLGEGVSLDRI